jgi:hypothetical protein
LEFVKWVLVNFCISNPIGIAIVVIGASFGGSAFYDYAISDTVKSTLNNWFSDTPEQKQQKFNFSTCWTLSFNSELLAVASSWSWNLLSGFWLISAKASSTQTGASGILL